MERKMNKIIIICGPTAAGKTKLAVKLCQKFNGEIISADSRQVYRGMDIGTGKEITNVKCQVAKRKIKNQYFRVYILEQIPIWLWDVVEPDQEFSVADYYKVAWAVIGNIWERGKLPFLVGGTGFYMKGIVDGIPSLGISPDWGLRRNLEGKDVKKLASMLKNLDPARWENMNDSDRQNSRRLIRAIEIAQIVKFPYSIKETLYAKNDVLFIGLKAPLKILYELIDKRVEERMEKGAEDEVRELLKTGYSWDLPAMSGMGYREFKNFFTDKITLEEAVMRWKFDEHAYARRQLIWFKKDRRIYWFDITNVNYSQEVEKLVRTWYNSFKV